MTNETLGEERRRRVMWLLRYRGTPWIGFWLVQRYVRKPS